MIIIHAFINGSGGKQAIKAQLFPVISVLVFTLSGCEVNFFNNDFAESTITDIDGNVYTTVKIGNQVWTVENLRTTRYNDGTPIPYIKGDTTWDSTYYTETGAYCYFANTTNSDSIKKYGALYNWYAVGTNRLAPAGWHVPTDAEWDTLQNYLITHGYNWDGTTTENKIAKSLAAKMDWSESTNDGAVGNDLTKNNTTCFAALPCGYRATYGTFNKFGIAAYWWTSSEYHLSRAHHRYLLYDNVFLYRYHDLMSAGLSVRLVRN